MSDLDRRMLLGAAGLVGMAALSRVAKAGPLNPPAGPVASSGKTLTEVEPRTLINATNTPGDANAVFVISQPGSYYLGTNLTVPSGKSGVRIDVSDVTVDLNGCTIAGSAAGGGGSQTGVMVSAFFLTNITVRNGAVRQMGSVGIALGGVTSARVEDVIASGNVSSGVLVGDRGMVTRVIADTNAPLVFNSTGIGTGSLSVVTHCSSSGNAGLGINVGDFSIVSECVAVGNQQGGIGGGTSVAFVGCVASNNGSYGFGCLSQSVIESCSAASNTGKGITTAFSCAITNCTARANVAGGIAVTDSSLIDRCTSSFNANASTTADGISFGKGSTIKDCVSNSNTGNGIAALTGLNAGNAATIRGCNAAENNLAGISAGSDSFITDNNCILNGANGFNASSNLLVNGSRNRIERNNSTKTNTTGFGINVAGTSNLTFGNSSTGSSTNWNFGNVNVYGPIVDRRTPPIVGAAGSGNVPSTMGTTDPFANITY